MKNQDKLILEGIFCKPASAAFGRRDQALSQRFLQERRCVGLDPHCTWPQRSRYCNSSLSGTHLTSPQERKSAEIPLSIIIIS